MVRRIASIGDDDSPMAYHSRPMVMIHPGSVVDPKAHLADDVQIGPGCIVDGPVVLGPGCHLIGNVHLSGKVSIGKDNTLYPFVCVGFPPQHRTCGGSDRGVVIGDRNVLRESATIHGPSEPAGPTTIGDDNYLMTNSHLGHDCVVGNRCTLASGALIGGHAHLEDDVFIGGNAAVHQFCRMGRMSFLGGISSVTKDVPPFAMANGQHNNVTGINLVGLRRSGMKRSVIDAVKGAFKTLYLSGHTNPRAAELIEHTAAENGPGAQQLSELVKFIRESQRGLCMHVAAPRKLHTPRQNRSE